MDKPLRVALYARVSTKDQNAETQLLDLRKYCEARGWTVQREFLDIGISGATDNRPALRDLMEFVRHRKADAVLVWRFDRFARSLKHLVSTLTEFNEIGVNFVSYTETLDTTTAQGRLLFTFLGAFHEFTREVIRENVRSGLRRRKANGERLGRQPLPAAKREEIRRVFIELSQRQGRRASYSKVAKVCGIAKSSAFKELRAVEAVFKPTPKLETISDGAAGN